MILKLSNFLVVCFIQSSRVLVPASSSLDKTVNQIIIQNLIVLLIIQNFVGNVTG